MIGWKVSNCWLYFDGFRPYNFVGVQDLTGHGGVRSIRGQCDGLLLFEDVLGRRHRIDYEDERPLETMRIRRLT